MARIYYVSRGDSGHDSRWTDTLSNAGHDVHTFKCTELASLVGQRPRHRPDLVVAGPLTDCASAALESGLGPVMGMAWGFDLLVEAADPAVCRRLTTVLPRLRAVHVDCHDMEVRAIRLGARSATVSVGAWGIDVDLFMPGPPSIDVKGQLGWGSEHTVVYTSRAWEPMYDVDVVLRGFAAAAKRDRSLRLAWAGGGSEGPRLRDLVERLGISDLVVELGRLPAPLVRDWLRSCDVYVSASRSDGSSVSLMEALAVGVPVAVTALASNEEWVTDADMGSVFPLGDSEALADGIRSLTSSASGHSDKRRSLVLEKGDWRKNAQVFLDAVEGALQ